MVHQEEDLKFIKKGFKIGVINLMGNVYMKKCEDVFPFIEEKIKKLI